MGKSRPLEERFWEKVDKRESEECWEWMAAIFKDKYGAFWDGTKLSRAHRVCWEIYYGNIPEGMLVCHHCDNPGCVNPKHLFVGTIVDNVKDRYDKGKSKGGSLPGEENPNHKLKEKEVLEIKRLYSRGGVSQRRLAKMFRVSRSTIQPIVLGRTWKYLEEQLR